MKKYNGSFEGNSGNSEFFYLRMNIVDCLEKEKVGGLSIDETLFCISQLFASHFYSSGSFDSLIVTIIESSQ